MTDTQPLAPTDAEIDALWVGQQLTVPQLVQRRVIARAALAKWGTLQPVAREPLTHDKAKTLVAQYGNDPLHLVLQVERHHGIKGGQHGTE